MTVASFDVFDTLVARMQPNAETLFFELGKLLKNKGIIKCSSDFFVRKRIQWENLARINRNDREVTIKEIYQYGRESADTPLLDPVLAMQAELDLEKKSIFPVEENLKLVEEYREKGARIWFISDMYLPHVFISEVLKNLGIMACGDALFVSGELRVSKHAATMFRYLIARESIKPAEWIHFGDNLHSDYYVPKSLGIHCKLLDSARLNYREEQFLKEARRHKSLAPIVGSCRASRLSCRPKVAKETRPLVEFSCSVAGPLLCSFVWWCLRKASKLGLKRLYFVSRDGQLPLRIAKIFCRHWSLETDCRYLYGSRAAWHLPGLVEFDSEQVPKWLLAGSGPITPQKILTRLGVFDPSALPNGFHPRQSLRGKKLKLFLSHICCEPLRSRIARSAADSRQLLSEYLHSESVFENTDRAIIDIGWHGNLQISLANALSAMGQNSGLSGLYMGLLDGKKPHSSQNLFAFVNEITGQAFPSAATYLAEILFPADHSSVAGYRREATGVVPVFRKRSMPSCSFWNVSEYQSAVLEFAENFSKCVDFHSENFKEVCRSSYKNFLNFFQKPSKQEANLFAKVSFCADQEEIFWNCPIPEIGIFDAAIAAWLPSRRPEGYWLEGSQVIHPNPFVATYLLLRTSKRLFGKIIKEKSD